MLRDSGLGYTVLRVAWYAENLTDLGLLPRVLAAGRWHTSAGEGRISYVPLADVACATAAALAAKDDQSCVYDITGQEAMSVPQIASARQRGVRHAAGSRAGLRQPLGGRTHRGSESPRPVSR